MENNNVFLNNLLQSYNSNINNYINSMHRYNDNINYIISTYSNNRENRENNDISNSEYINIENTTPNTVSNSSQVSDNYNVSTIPAPEPAPAPAPALINPFSQSARTTNTNSINTPVISTTPIIRQSRLPINYSTRVMYFPFNNNSDTNINNILENEINSIFNNIVDNSNNFFSNLTNIARDANQQNYDFFLNLFNNQDNNTQNINELTPEIIERQTTTFIYDESNNNINENERSCPISLIPYRNGDEIIRINYCNHCFLKENLLQWFSRSNKCPLCRYNILTNLNRENNES
jgi:hypothetical protein